MAPKKKSSSPRKRYKITKRSGKYRAANGRLYTVYVLKRCGGVKYGKKVYGRPCLFIRRRATRGGKAIRMRITEEAYKARRVLVPPGVRTLTPKRKSAPKKKKSSAKKKPAPAKKKMSSSVKRAPVSMGPRRSGRARKAVSYKY